MTDSEPAASSPPRRPGLSLRTKLFLPLTLLVFLIGVAVLTGSLDLVRTLARRNLDERLSSGREVIFRDIKKQEEVLLAYANFLEQFDVLASHFEQSDEIGILQDRLFSALEKERISVTFLYLSANSPSPIPALNDLFDQARRSHQPRFLYTDRLNGLPTLVVATPLDTKGDSKKFLLLQLAMGDDFLAKACKPLNLSASLQDLSGRILAKSSARAAPVQLQPEQITEMAQNGRIFVEHDSPDGPSRQLFALIPLGTSDMIMLSLESSTMELSTIQQSLVTRLALIIGVALLVGAIIYLRAVNAILRPAQELTTAAKALSRGNLAYRIEDIPGGEFGAVAETFNNMAEQLETIYREKTEKETALALAHQEIKNKSLIAHKNREVEKINEELRANLREISALYQLNQAMVSAPALNVMFDRVLQVVVETFNCAQVVLLLFNQGENVLEVVKSMGLNQEALQKVKFSLGQGITGQAAQSLRQIYVKDVEKDLRYLHYHGQAATRGSFVSSPMVIKGHLVGILNLHKREVAAFGATDLKMIQAIANQTGMAIDNAQLIERTRDLTNTDTLTGLANRRHFQEILKREVAQARRFDTIFSILMCDIDHFDLYNTKHGRMPGDALLRQVGKILLNNTRGIDLVCRFGSTEFAIMLPKTDKRGGQTIAEKLIQRISKEDFPGAAESQPGGRLTVSFGIAEFPTDSRNIYELFNLADRALYLAKKAGRNRAVAWEGPAPEPEQQR
jgi:diguanylate cyclase (GGDEF)-like protein